MTSPSTLLLQKQMAYGMLAMMALFMVFSTVAFISSLSVKDIFFSAVTLVGMCLMAYFLGGLFI